MLSVIIPAKNESASIAAVVERIRSAVPAAEILVVDDGSSDDTKTKAEAAGAHVVSHPTSLGNGAAIKTGSRHAKGHTLVFLDADAQHPPEAIPAMLEKLNAGYDMVVGARDRKGQANAARAIANGFYNFFASWIAEYPIKDLTSGFRAVKAEKFRQFLNLLPNRFSYPTTITMAFLKVGYSVAYHSVEVAKRQGKSHISPLKDGFRFLLIIFRIATLFSPMKLFVPTSLSFVGLGLVNYAVTYVLSRSFTNMSALLLTAGVIIFFVGLLSEQICALTYVQLGNNKKESRPDAP